MAERSGAVDDARGARPVVPVAGSGGRSFLFALFYGGGNVDLIMPVVQTMVARGHKVRVLAGPRIWSLQPGPVEPFLQRVRATGADVVPLPEASPSPHGGAVPLRGLFRGWTPRRLKKAVNIGLAARWWSVWAEATRSELERQRPDAVVADHFLLSAAAAAERFGIPFGFLVHNANHPAPMPGLPPPGTGLDLARNPVDRLRDRLWTGAFNRVSVRDAREPLNRARAELGLRPLRSPLDQYEAADRVIILSSRAFDFPATRLAENVRYTGFVVDKLAVGEWQSPWAVDDSRPQVLVNLSTLDQGQGPLMHRILRAVAEIPVRALVTLGPLDPAQFDAPPNARLVKFAPHAAVLPSVSAVVSQCGLGTVTKALLQGVPLICIPLTADQPDNAARVVALGAGVRLSHDCSTSEIRAAIERVLGDARFRESARRVGAAVALDNGADTAATELEALVLSSPPAARAR